MPEIINFDIDIPQYKTYSEIAVLGDLHKGNRFFDSVLWKRYYIGSASHKGFKDDSNMYVMCIGDLMETALKDSLGSQDQEEWIEDQYEWVKDQLEPIADEGRLIGILEGNHERRATRNWFRTSRLLARDLGVPYGQNSMIVNLILHKGEHEKKYKMFATHGSGSSRTLAGKLNTVMRMADIVSDADIYVCGHLHSRIAITAPIYKDDVEHERLFGMTGAYLSYGGYAEERMYQPPARGSLKLKLHYDIDRVSGR